MSFKAMTWAASVKTPTSTQKLVLLLLADRAGDDNTCFPSMQRIADDACISRRCAIENVKKLASNGFIAVEKRSIENEESGTAYNKSNLYLLNVGSYPLGHSNSKYVVVNVGNQGGEPDALGGELNALGVVNQMHPNQSLEPVKESVNAPEQAPADVESGNKSQRTSDGTTRVAQQYQIGTLFDRFWKVYPRKVGKGAARKAFAKALKLADAEAITKAVKAHSKSEQWTKDGGQFIPHPATWLNQERWEDEVESAKKDASGINLKEYGL